MARDCGDATWAAMQVTNPDQESRSVGHGAARHESEHQRGPPRRPGPGRSKQFYERLGWKVKHDYGVLVFFESDGGSLVGFYSREGLADQVCTSPEGSGFSGLVLTYVVRSGARVDEIITEAEKAGATILKPAITLPWGGYGGSFADPDILDVHGQQLDQPGWNRDRRVPCRGRCFRPRRSCDSPASVQCD